MLLRSLAVLLAALASLARAGSAPPFTLDSALASIAAQYPQATRVADGLPAGVEARENLLYCTQPSGELRLDLYRPADAKIHPAVILVHGGGWVAGDRTMERPLAKQLAARGYVAVPISYRLGETGKFPGAVHDLKAAVRWLRAHAAEHGIDAEHIGAIGGSAGGTLATFLGATNGLAEFEGESHEACESGPSSAMQAVVDIDGAATLLDNALIAQSEATPASPYYVYMHGIYSQARATWVAASPLTYVGRASAPTLFIKSTTLRPILPGRDEMAARLKVLGVDSAVVQFPDTPHVFWLFHPWFERVLDEADTFLRRHLMP